MSKKFSPIRGMSDTLWTISPYWRCLEQIYSSILNSYSYQEIRFPVVERSSIFQRSVGEYTDVVSKEMYNFQDKSCENLTLRPEGTTSCVRIGIKTGLLNSQIKRIWYHGPMFRYERPQKGRLRQFHQFGAEIFGASDPEFDAEILAINARLWKKIGINSVTTLEINNLGEKKSRSAYRKDLIRFLSKNFYYLDKDSKTRFEKNPLRILDSKDPLTREILKSAPILLDYLDSKSINHFEKLKEYLGLYNIPFNVNPFLVRGLDYYGSTVFEWKTKGLGKQNTICAGGRYDSLAEQLSNKKMSAVGFSLGVERMILMLKRMKSIKFSPDIYISSASVVFKKDCMLITERVRDNFPSLTIEFGSLDGNTKKEIDRAKKLCTRWFFSIDLYEKVFIKDLWHGKKEVISLDKVMEFIEKNILDYIV